MHLNFKKESICETLVSQYLKTSFHFGISYSYSNISDHLVPNLLHFLKIPRRFERFSKSGRFLKSGKTKDIRSLVGRSRRSSCKKVNVLKILHKFQ